MSQSFPPEYRAPSPMGAMASEPMVPGKVTAPAVALIVVGTINLLWALYSLITNALGANNPVAPPPDVANNPQAKEIFEMMQNVGPGLGIAISAVMLIVGGVVLFGGLQMLKARSWGLALSASILSMIPCISPLGCCLVGQAVGIWALVVLLQADVKAIFR